MSSIEPISFSHTEAYCSKCGKIEAYNGNKSYEKPLQCSYCGGRMINEGIEKILFDSHKLHKRSKEDEFTIKILETIKNKFEDNEKYSGKYIKLEIDRMIKRVE